MTVLAHVVTDASVVWYPLVALVAPAAIVATLTRFDSRAAAKGSGEVGPHPR